MDYSRQQFTTDGYLFGDSYSEPNFEDVDTGGDPRDTGNDCHEFTGNQDWHLISGNTETGVIDATTETVATPNNLQEIAQDTDHPNYNGIFSEFTKETSGDFGDGGSSSGMRHPLAVCRYVKGSCPQP